MKVLVACALLGLVAAEKRPPSNSYGPPSGSYGVDPEIAALTENIPGGGVPGEDFPILASVPETDFDCDAQDVPGYYADTADEAGCQVFHICQDRALRRQKDSFLCPNGTIFNQQYLVCDWWFNFDCSTAEDFYSVNEQIGVVPYGSQQSNGNGNGNGNNGYGSNGSGAGTGSNGYSSNGNGNGNGRKNGGGRKGKGKNGNGGRNGNGASYSNGAGAAGAASAPSESYGAPSELSESYGAPSELSQSYGAPL